MKKLINSLNLIGVFGIILIILLIFNRLRHRNPLYLEDEFHPFIKFWLNLIFIILFVNLIRIIYYTFFNDSINSKNSVILIIKEYFEGSKIETYFINIKTFLSPGIYNRILLKTYELINFYPFPHIITAVFNLIVFRNLFSNYKKEKNIPIYVLCYRKWVHFIFTQGYYAFKFLPICILQIVGIIEIYFNGKIIIYYKLLFLFLPAFLLNIVINHQIFYHSRERTKLELIYDVDRWYVLRDDSEDPANLYDVKNILFRRNIQIAAAFSPEEFDNILARYSYHCLREFAAFSLLRQMDYSHPFLKILLMILSIIFLVGLLYN